MLDRTHIAHLLKLNGVDISAPDEEIKSILLSARWHEKDVETALTVLRENTQTHEVHVDTMQKIFSEDENLRPETISALLGIDIDVKKDQLSKDILVRSFGISFAQIMKIVAASVCFSIVFVIASMWYLHVGMFYLAMR